MWRCLEMLGVAMLLVSCREAPSSSAPSSIEWSQLSGFDHEDGVPRSVSELNGESVEVVGFLLHLERNEYLLVERLRPPGSDWVPDIHEGVVVRSTASLMGIETCQVTARGRFEVGHRPGHSLYRLGSTTVSPVDPSCTAP